MKNYSFIKRKYRFRKILWWLLGLKNIVIYTLLVYIYYIITIVTIQGNAVDNLINEKQVLQTTINLKTTEIASLNTQIQKYESLINPILPEKSEASVSNINITESKLLARTIYFESAGESITGKIAVGNVVLNRMMNTGKNLKQVISSPDQFESYDKKSTIIEDLKTYKECEEIANNLLSGVYPDISNGAVYYHSKKIKPAWTKNMKIIAKIDNHIFYK